MEIVIKIPDKKYESLKILKAMGMEMGLLEKAVLNGTPLLKGHGALKDVDAIISKHSMIKYDWTSCVDIEDLKDAPTIVPADKEGVK